MLHYKKIGQGVPEIVLIHGFPNDHRAWDNIIEALAKEFTVIAVDLPGAGNSASLPEVELTVPLMAEEVYKVCMHEGISQAHFIGHSMGGYTTLNLAFAHPELFRAMTLVHSSAFADGPERLVNREKSIKLMTRGEREKEVFLKAMVGNFFAKSFAQSHPEVLKQYIARGMELSGDHLAAFYKAIMLRADRTDVLTTATYPIQFIIGDEDTAAPMEELLRQLHLPKICKVDIYQNCGHCAMEEYPERLTQDLLDFSKSQH